MQIKDNKAKLNLVLIIYSLTGPLIITKVT